MPDGAKRGRGGLPYPEPASQAVTATMRGNRRRDTRPELQIRSILHRRGLRFYVDKSIRTNGRSVRPDIVFPRLKVAVFIDGCFWHGCPEHGRRPRSNTEYWRWKLEQNHDRDARVTTALQIGGWDVLRIWEHVPPEEASDQIELALHIRRRVTGQ